MPFEITNQGDLFLIRMYGVVSAVDLDAIANEMEIAADSTPIALDRVTDLTGVDHFDVHFPEVNLLADRVRSWRFSRPLKGAIVVSERVQLGLARMFQTLNDNPHMEIRIVHSIAEARLWITGTAATG